MQMGMERNGLKYINLKKKNNGVYRIYRQKHSFMEDVITIRLMGKHGLDNVRGGTYCEEILLPDTIRSILKIIVSNNDLCFWCGRKGHYAYSCM